MIMVRLHCSEQRVEAERNAMATLHSPLSSILHQKVRGPWMWGQWKSRENSLMVEVWWWW